MIKRFMVIFMDVHISEWAVVFFSGAHLVEQISASPSATVSKLMMTFWGFGAPNQALGRPRFLKFPTG